MSRSQTFAFRTALVLAAVVLCLAAACKKKGGPAAPRGAGSSGESGAAGEAPVQAALVDDPVTALLPADTFFVATVSDPLALLDKLGRNQLARRFRAEYDAWAAGAPEPLRRALLDPEAFGDLGIDPHGPGGFFWLDLRGSVGGLHLRLSDPARLESFLKGLAAGKGEEVGREDLGDARILSIKGKEQEICLLIRGKNLLAVFSDQSHTRPAISAARTLARQDKAASLQGSPVFRKAVEALGSGRDLAAYVDLAAGVDAMSGRRSSSEAAGLLRKIWGPAPNLSMGFDLLGADIRFRARMALGGDAALGRIFRNGGKVSAVLRATSPTPMYLVSYTIDFKAYLDLVAEIVGKTSGQDIGALVRTQVKGATGLDLDADVLGALSGEVGVSIWGELSAMRGGLAVGLRDVKKGRKLLDALFGLPFVKGFAKADSEPGSWTLPLPIPLLDGPLHVRVAGAYLAASNDPSFFEGLGAEDLSGSYVARVKSAYLRSLLGRRDSAVVLSISQASAMGWLVLRGANDSGAVALAPEGRISPEIRAKQKEIAALRAEIRKIEEEREKAGEKRVMDLVQKIGPTVLVARVEPGALLVEGGQFTDGPDVAAVVSSAAEALVNARVEERRSYEKVRELRRRQRELRARIEALRQGPVVPHGPGAQQRAR